MHSRLLCCAHSENPHTLPSFQDMSAYVKKIQFKLHESYGNPLRGKVRVLALAPGGTVLVTCVGASSPSPLLPSAVVTKPPYEITETGWGEFEIIIKIFFIDPNERPVSTTNF